MAHGSGDAVEVDTVNGRPVRFVWRARAYTVQRVLEHWVTTRDWWLEHATASDAELTEREFWRVEAVRTEDAPRGVGVCELRYEAAAGTWTITRVWD
ncbi:DUF6504 family protein [Actinomadura flavalba]|uniref:DUF6504 family protein n=1 Tax=Actinomadura flavalba TaxID=1120938 RepID=UPI00037F57C1|nr:DUF6504 family protein [Actinomadura flavalba]